MASLLEEFPAFSCEISRYAETSRSSLADSLLVLLGSLFDVIVWSLCCYPCVTLNSNFHQQVFAITQILPINKESLVIAANILLDGGVICIPTDTVYGISCIADDVSAVSKVFRLKNRSEGVPLPIFISSLEEIDQLTLAFSKEGRLLAEAFWPGALTVVANKSSAIPDLTVAGFDTAGFRIPDHPVPIKLCELTGKPITGTSANISGQPESRQVDDVIRMFGKDNVDLDLILDGGHLSDTNPSTIIDVTSDSLNIIRIGMVSEKSIRSVLCQK